MTTLRTATETSAGHGPAPAPPIRNAGREELPGVVDVLARAFDEDPVVSWFVREDGRRDAGMRRFFEIAVRLTAEHEEIHTAGSLLGAALWVPPDAWRLGEEDVEGLLPDFAAAFGDDRLESRLEAAEMLDALHPDEPSWYLFFLGVDPAHRSRGLGSALLEPMLRRCDAARLPAYLEATSPRNVALYERHGFAVTDMVHLPDGGPPIWPMWREPAAAVRDDEEARR